MFRAACTALVLLAAPAAAQLRVVSWNVSDTSAADFAAGSFPDRRTAVTTVLSAIGTESVNGIARPVDVFLIQEARSAATTGQTFVDVLNGLYGAGTYAHGSVNGTSTGNGTQTVVYRMAAVNLIGETALAISNPNGAARDPLRHRIQPAGYAGADVYFYNSHYKSASGGTNAARRDAEATAVRADADALGAGVRAVYAGDFNTYSSSEAAYQRLRAAGAAQAVDPVLPATGNWTDGTRQDNRVLHSQSPVTTALYPSEATGGMDDRFDFQLPTAAAGPAGRGVHQVAGNYRVFGNNGTHAYNGELTSGSQPANVLTALRQTSEHLPVVVDYALPARLAATATVLNPRVIAGSTAGVRLTVSNSAPVGVAAGADVLDYTYAGSGNVTQGGGSAAGLAALAAANSHALGLTTPATPGTYSGAVTATATSPQAASTYTPPTLSVTAVSHANGSLSSGGVVASMLVDFGDVPVNSPAGRQLGVFNLPAAAGAALTAALQYRNLSEQTPGGPLSGALAPFTGDLPAGGGNWTLNLSAGSGVPGDFSDTVTLALRDEEIPGATDQFLTVTLHANFVPVPEPGAVAFVLAAAAGVGYARRRSVRQAGDLAAGPGRQGG